ncbi:uncharacterized protein G2W53_014537 [Senna tora]|uniref:Uncharacterized protein n=1 Tax=Senna tora TaxID=362788 RepID=A0A834WTW3_9FABA|nr:uncharacterized protein G2W53_014537 [Senna tora]
MVNEQQVDSKTQEDLDLHAKEEKEEKNWWVDMDIAGHRESAK